MLISSTLPMFLTLVCGTKLKGGAESLSVDWSISIDHPQPTYALLPIIIRQK